MRWDIHKALEITKTKTNMKHATLEEVWLWHSRSKITGKSANDFATFLLVSDTVTNFLKYKWNKIWKTIKFVKGIWRTDYHVKKLDILKTLYSYFLLKSKLFNFWFHLIVIFKKRSLKVVNFSLNNNKLFKFRTSAVMVLFLALSYFTDQNLHISSKILFIIKRNVLDLMYHKLSFIWNVIG